MTSFNFFLRDSLEISEFSRYFMFCQPYDIHTVRRLCIGDFQISSIKLGCLREVCFFFIFRSFFSRLLSEHKNNKIIIINNTLHSYDPVQLTIFDNPYYNVYLNGDNCLNKHIIT